MCHFYSSIIDRNLKLYDTVDESDSHEDVRKKYKLPDNKLKDRDIVRLEVTPFDWRKLKRRFSSKLWEYTVDEKGTLPSWYKTNETKIKTIVFNKLKRIYKDKFLFGNDKRVIKKGRIWLFDRV